MYTVEGPIITCKSFDVCSVLFFLLMNDHTAYPEPHRRGRMLGLWVFMRNAAPVIGGAIIFSLNSNLDSSGGVSLKTYLVIIGIMCAGPFISTLLSTPEKVQRKDGKKIQMRKAGWKQTFSEWYRVVSSPDASAPIFCLCVKAHVIFRSCSFAPCSSPHGSMVPTSVSINGFPDAIDCQLTWNEHRDSPNTIYERPHPCSLCVHDSLGIHRWWFYDWTFPRQPKTDNQATCKVVLDRLDGVKLGALVCSN